MFCSISNASFIRCRYEIKKDRMYGKGHVTAKTKIMQRSVFSQQTKKVIKNIKSNMKETKMVKNDHWTLPMPYALLYNTFPSICNTYANTAVKS